VSSEGFLIRFLLGLLGSLAAISFAVGYVMPSRDAQGQVLAAGVPSGSWATPAELTWLQRLGSWDTRLLRGLQAAAPVERTVMLHSRALEPTGSCTSDLTTQVGSPPTSRLEPAFDALRRACTHFQRFHVAITLAIDQGHTSEIGKARAEEKLAAGFLLTADQMLPPGEVRALPVIAGEAEQSRVEPRFGRIASTLAGKAVEVRCWSRADWSQLTREESSYTHGKLGPETLAFVAIGGTRIHLGPAVCGGLVDLTYEGLRPNDEAGQLFLASAVVTLSHEPQHSKGIATEFVAECNAIQVANGTAIKLGASPAYAAALVRTYWRHYGDELPSYRSAECRKSGRLDLHRPASTWP
jgi:hypothetical protein